MTQLLELPQLAAQWAFSNMGTGADPIRLLENASRVPSTRAWSLFDLEPPASVSDRRHISDLVDTIRKSFRLSITELAWVMRVKRPTIYSWLRDNPELRFENEERLRLIASMADEWLTLVRKSPGSDPIDGVSPSRNFVASLAVEILDVDAVRLALADEARASTGTRRSRFKEDLETRTPRRLESNFDVATGRPLGPQLIE